MADRPPKVPKLIGDTLGLNPLEADSDDVTMIEKEIKKKEKDIKGHEKELGQMMNKKKKCEK